ncbi:hypothetical protein HYW76_04435, partial [Candidatus Pacearchaeota archaeon]|nr:hypothetical protein [Candidatus Pacearchaeota archaeon]
ENGQRFRIKNNLFAEILGSVNGASIILILKMRWLCPSHFVCYFGDTVNKDRFINMKILIKNKKKE